MILNKKNRVGIVSYGAKIPRLKVLGEDIAQKQGKSEQKIYASLGVFSKTVPNVDEDTITLATAAGFEAIDRLARVVASEAKKLKQKSGEAENSAELAQKKVTDALKIVQQGIGALFIGSESHPYAVKPSGTVVAQALGIVSNSEVVKPLALADLQFACKAGTQALQIASLYASSGFCEYAVAIGADTAQAESGDVLEYTAGAGAGCFIMGTDHILARLVATTSVATDLPDFWRRPKEEHPQHAGRFTAEPGYFSHISMAVKQIFHELDATAADFDFVVFHTPNGKFPLEMARRLGFTHEQIKHSLLVSEIGNTYAGATMLGLIETLTVAPSNKKILVASYGSGAGSDAFVFETTELLPIAKKLWRK